MKESSKLMGTIVVKFVSSRTLTTLSQNIAGIYIQKDKVPIENFLNHLLISNLDKVKKLGKTASYLWFFNKFGLSNMKWFPKNCVSLYIQWGENAESYKRLLGDQYVDWTNKYDDDEKVLIRSDAIKSDGKNKYNECFNYL